MSIQGLIYMSLQLSFIYYDRNPTAVKSNQRNFTEIYNIYSLVVHESTEKEENYFLIEISRSLESSIMLLYII